MAGIRNLVNRVMSRPLRLTRLVTNSSLFDPLVLRNKYSLGHLRHFEEYVVGPIQRDEALLLFALVVTVDPKTIVEFGFYQGHSAINFLKAMSSDAKLYSYDISKTSLRLVKKIRDKRFKFVFKSQADFESSDIDDRLIDLVFFDAGHDFHLNVVTFEKVREYLTDRALIVVHDTGAYYVDMKGIKTPKGYFLGGSVSSGYIHQPDERKFVNYIKTNMKDFDQVHIHSTSKFRHGLTVLQRNAGLLPL